MRLRRSRLVALLAAIVCVALAAVVLRSAETKPEYAVVRGTLGAPTVVEDGEITVADVRVGSQLTRDGSVTDTTPGMFVVVSVTAAATGTRELTRGDARLLARGGRVYSSYGFSSVHAAPGFAEHTDYLFEVDPQAITDLTVEIWQVELIHGYQQRQQVHLGITAENAAAWRTAAAGQAVEPAAESTEVIR